jgi:hypothetical protein
VAATAVMSSLLASCASRRPVQTIWAEDGRVFLRVYDSGALACLGGPTGIPSSFPGHRHCCGYGASGICLGDDPRPRGPRRCRSGDVAGRSVATWESAGVLGGVGLALVGRPVARSWAIRRTFTGSCSRDVDRIVCSWLGARITLEPFCSRGSWPDVTLFPFLAVASAEPLPCAGHAPGRCSRCLRAAVVRPGRGDIRSGSPTLCDRREVGRDSPRGPRLLGGRSRCLPACSSQS